MTLKDLERLSKILNDTKHRAVSLRQLSFLFHNLGYLNSNFATACLISLYTVCRKKHSFAFLHNC